jgi:hypothetical protein
MRMTVLTSLFVAFLAGCVHVPPQSAELSAMVGAQVAKARKHDADMIDAFAVQTQKLIDERMQYFWVPRMIRNMLEFEDSDGKSFDDTVCEQKGMNRALELQEFIEALNKQVCKKRASMEKPLRKEVRNLRKTHRDMYDHTERMVQTLTENLQSVLKDQERRDKVLKAWNLPTDMATPIEQATQRINKILED